jgi:uncharacterized protein (DUF488 family)
MGAILYTIGHSSYPLERFISLLKKHRIETICDVRSSPYSRVNPHFNREALERELKAQHISYGFLGKELGARSDDLSLYVNGKLSYERLSQTALFREGLRRVREIAEGNHVALMCAEKDPLQCHRTILICRNLHQEGVQVSHILENGTLENHEDSLERLLKSLRLSQPDMYKSKDEIIAEAYAIQGERISYELQRVEG